MNRKHGEADIEKLRLKRPLCLIPSSVCVATKLTNWLFSRHYSLFFRLEAEDLSTQRRQGTTDETTEANIRA